MPEKAIGLKEALRHYNGLDGDQRVKIESKKEHLRITINKMIRDGFLEHGATEKGFCWEESIGLSPNRLNEIVVKELAEEYLPLNLILEQKKETKSDAWNNKRQVEMLSVRPIMDKVNEILSDLKRDIAEEKKRAEENARTKALEEAKQGEERKINKIKEQEEKQKQWVIDQQERTIKQAQDKLEEARRAEAYNKANAEATSKHTPDEITRALFNLEAAKHKMSIVWKPDSSICGYLFFGEVSPTLDPRWAKEPKLEFSNLDLVEFAKTIRELKYKISLFSWIYAWLFLTAYFHSISRGSYLGLQALRVKDPLGSLKSFDKKVEDKIEEIVNKEIEAIERPINPHIEKVWM